MPLIRKPASPTTAVPEMQPDAAGTLRLLVAGDDDERWTAARAAATLPGAVDALGAALQTENNSRVREAMMTSLARIATADSVRVLLPLIRSEDARVRAEALDALTAMKEVAWPFLPGLLADANADVRILACELVRTLPGGEATDLLARSLDAESEPNVCAALVEVLAAIGEPRALPALTRCEQRFAQEPFLAFSIRTAADRIRTQSPGPRG